MEVKLLDCTLRDGGYINDWNFGNSIIRYMLQRYIKSNVDIVEIGFLDDRRQFDVNRTIFPNTACAEEIYRGVDKGNTKFVAMIDYGTCDISNLAPKSESIIDGIRIIFKKPNFYKAIEFAKEVIQKGYFVSLNMVSITSYSDQDVLDFCRAANEINPYAVAIVDTYGLMHKEQTGRYFDLLNHNLNTDIAIGYHSHNNFQLAYCNTVEILNWRTNRTIILDGTAYGMGKSAGNAPIELLAMYLNEYQNKKYDINQFLEIIETAILPIFRETPWGYSLLYYLAASNNCHPNYVTYLLGKYSLPIESINDILKQIDKKKKLSYDEEYIKEIYERFRDVKVDDNLVIHALRDMYKGKDILLLAPGKTITTEYDKVNNYIAENSPVVIAVNFIPKNIKIDLLFIGNSKRYGTMMSDIEGSDFPIVGTSNVSCLNGEIKYRIDCARVLDEQEDISDNSLAMVLNFLLIVEPHSLTLAGADGYDVNNADDLYCEESFNLSYDYKRLKRVNQLLKEKISSLNNTLNISFLTKSNYEEKAE